MDGEDLPGREPITVALRLLALGYSPADEGTVVLLQRVELRQREAGDEALGVARIDPADEGIYGVAQEVPAEATAHQCGQRLVGIAPSCAEGLGEEAQLVSEGEKRGL